MSKRSQFTGECVLLFIFFCTPIFLFLREEVACACTVGGEIDVDVLVKRFFFLSDFKIPKP